MERFVLQIVENRREDKPEWKDFRKKFRSGLFLTWSHPIPKKIPGKPGPVGKVDPRGRWGADLWPITMWDSKEEAEQFWRENAWRCADVRARVMALRVAEAA